MQARLHAPQARKVRSYCSSAPSSNCSTVMVHVAGSSLPRRQEILSQVSHSASARTYASSSGRISISLKLGGDGPLPTSRKRAGEEDHERCRAGEGTAKGGVPGVKRSARQEQHTKATLHAAQAWVACAHTRACAMCQGSEGLGAGRVARSVIATLLDKGG